MLITLNASKHRDGCSVTTELTERQSQHTTPHRPDKRMTILKSVCLYTLYKCRVMSGSSRIRKLSGSSLEMKVFINNGQCTHSPSLISLLQMAWCSSPPHQPVNGSWHHSCYPEYISITLHTLSVRRLASNNVKLLHIWTLELVDDPCSGFLPYV